MDDFQPSASSSSDQDLSYIANDPRVGRLVRVLADLGTELQQEVETHRTRADTAERRLDSTTAELQEAQAELEALRAQLETLKTGVRDYFAECADSHEALLAVTRYALGLAPLPLPFDSEPPNGAIQAAQEPGATPHPFDGWPSHSGSPRNLLEVQGIADLRDEPTDEHKIIDDRNRLDMERLNARSYVHAFRAGRATS